MGSKVADASAVSGHSSRNADVENYSNDNCTKNLVKNAQLRREGHLGQVTYATRYVYNTKFKRNDIEGLLVRPINQAMMVYRTASVQKHRTYANVVRSGHISTPGDRKQLVPTQGLKPDCGNMSINSPRHIRGKETVTKCHKSTHLFEDDIETNIKTKSLLNSMNNIGEKQHCHTTVVHKVEGTEVNSIKYSDSDAKTKLLYDSAVDSEDKYLHSLFFGNCWDNRIVNSDCNIYHLCRQQSDMKFGFIPLSDPILPVNYHCRQNLGYSVVELHSKVKEHKSPNFIGARIPVPSQLNIPVWKDLLSEYWDQQLLQFLEFGFPLGFNRDCPLSCDGVNHKSATEFPADVDAYIQEEKQYGAIVGPFCKNPIAGCHVSPIMTRPKANSDTRRVIIDLSWPKGVSVNDGVDKLSYMGSEFKLIFPTIDDLTSELRKLGRGAHIYKIDVSRAFRHLNMDPNDYDLLGLQWQKAYIDTRLPFGSRHGSQMFQRCSDAVRYIMKCQNYDVINYCDDFLGFGTPTTAKRSFDALYDAMQKLGLSTSKKKLVYPGTQAVCLGVLVDTVKGTVSIPDEKLMQVKEVVNTWSSKAYCTKRQLQSLVGLLLYIHKCVGPARYFVNRMLEVLRNAQNPSKILLTDDFMRDLSWFKKILDQYNGTSLFDHRPVECVIELDACLTGLGGCWKNFVYHLAIPLGYNSMGIVHLEMINILVALKLFKNMWSGKKVLIKCDNQAVVTVLRSGRTKDPFLGACARNVWFTAAVADVELQYTHVLGKNNRTADLLSRWQNSPSNVVELKCLVPDAIWLSVDLTELELDVTL